MIGFITIPFKSKTALKLLALLLLSSMPHWALAFDSQPHVLTLVGHTHSLEWSDAENRLFVTCDYKSLEGVTPKKGENCDGKPRLTLSVEDLKSLKYVVFDEVRNEFIYDNSRIIERIYEKFDDILIVIDPERVGNYPGYPSEEQGQTVKAFYPVDIEVYNFYARKASQVLAPREGTARGNLYASGAFIQPYSNDAALGLNAVEMEMANEFRPLAEYSLAFFPKNPRRTAIIHELLHHLINRARKRSLHDPNRITELGKNDGLISFYYDRTERQEKILPPPEVPETDEVIADYQLKFRKMFVENVDSGNSEEMEIIYFISKFGQNLGMSTWGIESHTLNISTYIENYEGQQESLAVIDDNRLRDPAFAIVKENSPYRLGQSIVENYFPILWEDARALTTAYPRNLLPPFVERFESEFGPIKVYPGY